MKFYFYATARFASAALKNRGQSGLAGSISALSPVLRGIPTWSPVLASGMAVTAELQSWSCFWRLPISSLTA